MDNLEIASICGHRKACAHWLPEKAAPGSLSSLPAHISQAEESHRVFELKEEVGEHLPPPQLADEETEAQGHTVTELVLEPGTPCLSYFECSLAFRFGLIQECSLF